MNYSLNSTPIGDHSKRNAQSTKQLLPLLVKEKKDLIVAFVGIFFNASSNLIGPVIIGYTIDHYIQTRNFPGVLMASAWLLGIYLIGFIASYIQTIRMGTVGRHVLFHLRNEIFLKLQELPVAFFNQNKVGDLISRINNDTDKLSQFFAQALMQFVNNFFMIAGAGVLLLVLNFRLGSASLVPAVVVLMLTQLLSPWVKSKNLKSLQSLGGMSAEIQESLTNFKVIVAFNRMDYFRDKFSDSNEVNFKASTAAGIANNVFSPIYVFASSLAQLIVLIYGVSLIASGTLTVGLLVGFLMYVNNFYTPLRQVATSWASFQQSLAALERISEVLRMSNDMETVPAEPEVITDSKQPIHSFKNVSFRYPNGKTVLKHINFKLERGKTYALVGPTGGGKTTAASLMARLYDATEGIVELDGRDIRSYSKEDRSRKIGFILQEPFLFSGTILDNLFYGHPDFARASKDKKLEILKESGMEGLLINFAQGLDTALQTSGESVSLGQRQLIAFVRAVLRRPELLILDEATANIDTVTEQLLEQALAKLPAETTKVIIAHRLNTIENADEIYFVNNGEFTAAGSFEHAVELLMHGKRST